MTKHSQYTLFKIWNCVKLCGEVPIDGTGE